MAATDPEPESTSVLLNVMSPHRSLLQCHDFLSIERRPHPSSGSTSSPVDEVDNREFAG